MAWTPMTKEQADAIEREVIMRGVRIALAFIGFSVAINGVFALVLWAIGALPLG